MSNLREATANRLYGYDCGYEAPPMPCHIPPLSAFEDMMYKVAFRSGYAGTKAEFNDDLAAALNGAQTLAGLVIQKDSVKDFPDIGVENAIYIDTSTKQIYFWKEDGYYKVNSGSGEVDPDPDNPNPDEPENPEPPVKDEIIYEGGEL